MLKQYDQNFLGLHVLFFFFGGCFSLSSLNEELTFEKTSYDGRKLKLNGLYYSTDEVAKGHVQVFFFNQNGVIIDIGVVERSELPFLRERLTYDGNYKDVEWMWGLYHVKNDSIEIEKLHPGGNYVAFIDYVKIVNDSTLYFSRRESSRGPKIAIRVDRVFHFKKYLLKPDSVSSILDRK